MVETVSRNGNFLINIGPRGDGTIPEWQVDRLQAMGRWLKINGDTIYGTRYWKEFAQENEQLSFTTKGKKLFVIKLATLTSPFTIHATIGWKEDQVKAVRLLGSDTKVTWTMTSEGLQIEPPKDLGSSQFAWSFEILTDEKQHQPNAILNDADKMLEHTRRVNLDGHDQGNSSIENTYVLKLA